MNRTQHPPYWNESTYRETAARNARHIRRKMQRREELLDIATGVLILVSITGKPVKLEKESPKERRILTVDADSILDS